MALAWSFYASDSKTPPYYPPKCRSIHGDEAACEGSNIRDPRKVMAAALKEIHSDTQHSFGLSEVAPLPLNNHDAFP